MIHTCPGGDDGPWKPGVCNSAGPHGFFFGWEHSADQIILREMVFWLHDLLLIDWFCNNKYNIFPSSETLSPIHIEIPKPRVSKMITWERMKQRFLI